MTTVRPFKGHCVRADLADKLLAPAYDVVSFEEARDMADGNEYSFFRCSRSEIEFPEGADAYDKKVYQHASENLQQFIKKGWLVHETAPVLYIYAQRMGSRIQYGIMAETSLVEYEKNIIKKHELTRAKKEDDRLKIIDAQNSHAEPVFFTYQPVSEIDMIVANCTKRKAYFSFVDKTDGVEHTMWKMSPEESILVEKLFKEQVKVMYIADGHHRTQAAYRLYKQRKEQYEKEGIPLTGEEDFCFVMALIYPCDQVHIWEYNRVIKSLEGKTNDQIIEELSVSFDIKRCRDPVDPKPREKGEFSMLLDRTWFTMSIKEKIRSSVYADPLASLDSEILTNYALKPVFGIGDIRMDERIDFVGGMRGIKELERRCETDCKVAFSLYPVDVREVMAIADGGLIMPPKSTWFAPKPLSGAVVHMLEKPKQAMKGSADGLKY